MEHVIEMTLRKLHWIIISLALASSLIAGAVIFGLSNGDPSSAFMGSGAGKTLFPMQGSMHTLELSADFPDVPDSVPVYVVKSVDSIHEGNEKLNFAVKKSIPTAEEAPYLAEKSLEAYGGLPKDASLINAVPLYRSKYNLTTQIVEEKYPIRTQVRYRQKINGRSVYKSGINLMLGENGEIVNIFKHWITDYEYYEDVPIISARQGYDRLKKGETTVTLQGNIPEGSKISSIELGYYFDEKNSKVLKPVWVFKTIMAPDLEPYNLFVDASQ
jgi:hypothetical protein